MARYESPRKRESKSGPKSRYSKKDSWGGKSFEDGPRGRGGPRRESGSYGKNRRDVEMTKVSCSECGVECEVPFKPTSSKPVYCDDCFAKKGKTGSNKLSKDFEIINEKLNKIMKALEIE